MPISKIKHTLIAAIFALFISFSFLATEGEAALWDTPLRFANPIKGVHTASQPISGAAWIETGDGARWAEIGEQLGPCAQRPRQNGISRKMGSSAQVINRREPGMRTPLVCDPMTALGRSTGSGKSLNDKWL